MKSATHAAKKSLDPTFPLPVSFHYNYFDALFYSSAVNGSQLWIRHFQMKNTANSSVSTRTKTEFVDHVRSGTGVYRYRNEDRLYKEIMTRV